MKMISNSELTLNQKQKLKEMFKNKTSVVSLFRTIPKQETMSRFLKKLKAEKIPFILEDYDTVFSAQSLCESFDKYDLTYLHDFFEKNGESYGAFKYELKWYLPLYGVRRLIRRNPWIVSPNVNNWTWLISVLSK